MDKLRNQRHCTAAADTIQFVIEPIDLYKPWQVEQEEAVGLLHSTVAVINHQIN